MPLNQSQKDKAIEWLGSHVSGLCPSCSATGGFALIEEVFAGVVLDENSINLGKSIPMIGLMCNTCFNIRIFSAIAVGITKRTPPDPADPKTA